MRRKYIYPKRSDEVPEEFDVFVEWYNKDRNLWYQRQLVSLNYRIYYSFYLLEDKPVWVGTFVGHVKFSYGGAWFP